MGTLRPKHLLYGYMEPLGLLNERLGAVNAGVFLCEREQSVDHYAAHSDAARLCAEMHTAMSTQVLVL